MGSIPLPALGVQTNFASPLDEYMRASQLKGQVQQQQLQAQEIQLRNQQIQDQTALTNAMKDWNPEDGYGALTKLALGHGASGNAAMQIQQHAMDLQTAREKLTQEQRDNYVKNQSAFGNLLQGVENVKDEELADHASGVIDSAMKSGLISPMEGQQYKMAIAQSPDAQTLRQKIDTVAKMKQGAAAIIGQKKTEAETEEATQKGKQAGAEAALAEQKANVIKNISQNPQAMLDQVDKIAKPGTPLNIRTKAQIQMSLNQGDVESAKKALEQASEEVGGIEKTVATETDPRVLAARTQQAVNTEVKKQQALAAPLEQIQSQTRAGRTYINRDDIPKGSEGVTEQAARAAGIPVVDKDVGSTLKDIDTAKANQQYMLDLVGKKLASGAKERLWYGPKNTIEKMAQTDRELASMGTFRNAAIQSMRAVAGSKGLRINQSEINMAIDNDIPKMTDTLPVAQQKLKNLTAFLDDTEQSHLTQNRTKMTSPNTSPNAAPKTNPVKSDGGAFNWESMPTHQ